MEKVIYRTNIVQIGKNALTFLNEKMLIFFNKKAQSDLAEYSVLIDDGEGVFDISHGDYLVLGDTQYRMTAIGSVALRNFEALGHAVIRFDGKETAELPGNFHVEDKEIVELIPDLAVSFIRSN